MDWNLLIQSYEQFGIMYLMMTIGMATVVALLDSLPMKTPRMAAQH